MKFIKYTFVFALGVFILLSFKSPEPKTSKYKCMIQLKNYNGEGAYVIVSLLNPEGDYENTLQVLGDDSEWYHDLTRWWKYYGKDTYNIDAITGASITSGQRTIKVIEIPDDKINKGYKIRFETAVEDEEYYPDDVLVEINEENLKGKKVEGNGYIRYIRILPQK